MGEAKRKRKKHGNFLQENPWCCYCDGKTPATTVDHVPSRQMFTGRRRPKGLEAPACVRCNHATRLDEQVAAMLARSYPDSSTEEEQREIEQIFKAIANNHPYLLQELQPSAQQNIDLAFLGHSLPGDIGGALNCQGPLLNKSIGLFGAKIGLALHYSATGRIVPSTGGVAVKWYTNYDRLTGRFPDQVLNLLGPPATLQQGKWRVSEQFEYAYAIADTQATAAYMSTFRQSFAVLSCVGEDTRHFGDIDRREIYRPGFITN